MPPFRLQYASNLFVDLHKQKYDSLVRPISSTLALLGNIGRPDDAKTYHFLNYCSRNWDTTVWVTGSHELMNTSGAELSYSEGLDAVNTLSEVFPNVRCLDSNEEVFSVNNTVLLGLPPQSPSLLERFYKSSLTHTMLRTVFWTMTNPMANIVFLTSTTSEKNLLPLQGSRLDSPSSLWLVGDAKKNALAIDSVGKQFFATNKCFGDTKLRKLSSYSPIAFVEFVNRHTGVSLQLEKQSLQLA